jgi:hypothetical protein
MGQIRSQIQTSAAAPRILKMVGQGRRSQTRSGGDGLIDGVLSQGQDCLEAAVLTS